MKFENSKTNETAKMDKFIFASLFEGFKAIGKEPDLPSGLALVKNIEQAIQDNLQGK